MDGWGFLAERQKDGDLSKVPVVVLMTGSDVQRIANRVQANDVAAIVERAFHPVPATGYDTAAVAKWLPQVDLMENCNVAIVNYSNTSAALRWRWWVLCVWPDERTGNRWRSAYCSRCPPANGPTVESNR